MGQSAETQVPWPACSLLLFVATSAEEAALKEQAGKLGLDFQKDADLTRYFQERGLRDEAWTLGACAKFRNELYTTAPHGDSPIIGGEMEGVGLLAAAVKADDPAWCVVKGIGDFADERRDKDIEIGRTVAPQNAAFFVLSSLVNDAKMLAE